MHLLGITQDRKTSITMLSKENRETTASPTLGDEAKWSSNKGTGRMPWHWAEERRDKLR